ncbi:MAG: SUF system NifU family Fe-S cluster assembly protein [Planctomycetota bacterium]|nr:MAG: SUF system NifU family Fe-S cluster assembly protein [Planctomycetota bacterium]
MFDLTDLYQELILDHNRSPRNHGRLDDAGRRSEGYNPLCGDRVTVYLALDGEVISDVAFEGVGCAISTAAASLMTEAVKGKTMTEATVLFERFREMVTADAKPGHESLGKLEAFAGVRNYPARVKCATLAWHTLKAAIDAENEVVTTE